MYVCIRTTPTILQLNAINKIACYEPLSTTYNYMYLSRLHLRTWSGDLMELKSCLAINHQIICIIVY